MVMTCNDTDVNQLDYLQPCAYEEADTRILLHVAHCASQGYQRVIIRTVDTDVVILL